jgi:predicted MFS family arabinose efflux permease
VQTGLIVGTVYSRAAGGFIGAHFGWRIVFWFAAAVTALSTVALARALPLRKPHSTLTYAQLLRSLVTLTRQYPALRASMGLGFCAFATFSAFWTTIAFHLRVLGYGSDVVGTLGLISIAGAFVAIPFGSLADRRGTVFTAALAIVALTVSFAIFLAGAHSLVAFFIGMVCFPIGIQLNQISNQSRIFGLDAQARSRLNTAYMCTTFMGGAVGAFAGAAAWQAGGWPAVCIFSLISIACAGLIVVWLRLTAGAGPSLRTSDVPAGEG